MKKPVIIIGAKGLGKVALEIFRANEIIVYGFLEDNKDITSIDDISVIGDPFDEQSLQLITKDTNAFVAIEEQSIRKDLTQMLHDKKIAPMNAIHPKAYLAESASIGYGNLIDAGVYINTHTEIKDHCIIKQGANIDHDVTIESFVQLGVGVNVGSQVQIGQGTFVGTGATIVSGIKIGQNARVGAGAVVINDISDDDTVFGNPAQSV